VSASRSSLALPRQPYRCLVRSPPRCRPDSPTDASVASPLFRPAGPKPPLVYGPEAAVAFTASAQVSRCTAVSSHRAGHRSPLLCLSAWVTVEPRVSEHHRRQPSTPVISAASPFFARERPLSCPLSLRRSPCRRAVSAAVPSRALAQEPFTAPLHVLASEPCAPLGHKAG
jgi:hypothetical protein